MAQMLRKCMFIGVWFPTLLPLAQKCYSTSYSIYAAIVYKQSVWDIKLLD
jgi:hypothetical protein